MLHYLLARYQPSSCQWTSSSLGTYDALTTQCVRDFQQATAPTTVSGVVDPTTARLLLSSYSYDQYQDDGATAQSQGYLYKILIPVHRNRSIQTVATFLDGNNTALFTFPVRTKGHVEDGCGHSLFEPWPNFNNTGNGLNMYSSGGMTPTGLIEIDPNSPEGNASLYGPYPITRFVRGLKGNALFLLPTYRNGILIHTGQWGNFSNWKPPMDMPNSAGCVHTWPMHVAKIWHAVVQLGGAVRKNTNGKTPYPFRPQGIASVYLVD